MENFYGNSIGNSQKFFGIPKITAIVKITFNNQLTNIYNGLNDHIYEFFQKVSLDNIFEPRKFLILSFFGHQYEKNKN